jgi:hypothetical protein
VPGLLVHVHLHEDIAGIKLALALAALAVAHLHHFFGGDEDLAELVFETVAFDALLERLRNAMFEVRIGVNHVPA